MATKTSKNLYKSEPTTKKLNEALEMLAKLKVSPFDALAWAEVLDAHDAEDEAMMTADEILEDSQICEYDDPQMGCELYERARQLNKTHEVV